MSTLTQKQPRASGNPDAELCEAPQLAHPNPQIEQRLRRICRIEYVELMHWQALARLADERERLEAELAELDP